MSWAEPYLSLIFFLYEQTFWCKGVLQIEVHVFNVLTAVIFHSDVICYSVCIIVGAISHEK